MIIEDQSDAIAWLATQSTQSKGPDTERIETHISEIFLTGERAYKLKRAVKLPYADFSTPQIRLHACEKELALNVATLTQSLWLRFYAQVSLATGLSGCAGTSGASVSSALGLRPIFYARLHATKA